MKRLIDKYLLSWRNNPERKALLLRGARQVGKTYSCRKLGKAFDHFIEINFEISPQYAEIFNNDLVPQRIVRDIELLSGKKIIPGKTLLFFDEIQESPKAIKSLRYFYELLPELHVVAAGSLLDFTLENIGMPVGRVESFYMYPLSFLEFLMARGDQVLTQFLLEYDFKSSQSNPVHNKLMHILGEYIAVGGLPEIVKSWINRQDIKVCSEKQVGLIEAYRQDFLKYAKRHQIKYVDLVFDEVPRMVGRKFKFSQLPGNWRKRELAPAFDLLVKASVIHSIKHSSANGVPLGGEVNPDRFKVICLDVGLSQAILGLDLSEWILKPEVSIVNRGAIAEAFVGQELLAYSSPSKKAALYYWHREAHSSNAEVDYIIQSQDRIVPIEVKSGARGTLRSLNLFLKEKASVSSYGIRFSSMPFSFHNDLHSYPLYAVSTMIKDELSSNLTDFHT